MQKEIVAVHFYLNDVKHDTSQKKRYFISKLGVKPMKHCHKTKTQCRYRIKDYNPKKKHYTKKIDGVNVIYEIIGKQKLKRGKGIIDVIKNPISTVKQLIWGIDRFNFRSQKTIKEYGNELIISYQIARTPLNRMLEGAVNALSFGAFKQLQNTKGYDKLFHLSLILTLKNGVKLIYEKNETVDIQPLSESNSLKSTTEYMYIPLGKLITLNQFIANAQERMGEDYFTYRALNNNCQNFIIRSLAGSNLLTSDANKFIYQDMTEIRKELSKSHSYFEPLVNTVTDLGAKGSLLLGRGIEKINKYFKKHIDKILKIIKDDKFRYI